MKSTLARFRAKFTGKNVPWVRRIVDQYVAYVEEHHSELKVHKTPYAKFHGDPHASPKTNDPFHASVAFRKKKDFKGSGFSLHVYPDGTVIASKSGFPSLQMPSATAEELGDNAYWLNPQYVQQWKAQNEASSSNQSSSRGGQSSPSRGSSSDKATGKAKASDKAGYQQDPTTGAIYRYLENSAAVYLHPKYQREYYYDEEGTTVWL
ncbi:hypothetical protein MAC_06713 [Metarhizium acridum CQMa 102]|uniref:Uncharacterized protein n=1 Tax=Metarhizium acridum (strain CQMa 102) TaxID=655827 RepID=E9EA15_METAQ|nr:uncharacterized protein MAC_06713 [Metarhizium acridum CQMa 102]EFY87265.1 hypothetical protein MAC_06713 [Metarhizium acridum CQMa 102]